ncbi:hypothetical protein MD484_g5097, partial [Candolleomyces efflorescens]
MLGIIPQITIVPSIESSSLLSDAASQEAFHSDLPAALGPDTTSVCETEVVPGPPLGKAELEASAVVAVTPPPTLNPVLINARPLAVYLPENFIHLSVPYECPLCADTFRTVASLTAHMNSPVHDAKEFLCPKCEKQFVVVSALIQHLESGCCGLASMKEVFERFGQVTAGVSRFLLV